MIRLPKITLLFTLIVLLPLVSVNSQTGTAVYRNPRAPVEQRIADLLRRMTVEEKVAQLGSFWEFSKGKPEPQFSEEKFKPVLANGIGHLARQREFRDPRQSAEFANAVQKWLREKTRLGIPAILHDEGLHGHMASGGTVFPQPIAMASTWDTELIGRIFAVVALETRARGGHQILGPNMDLARDPRWGRTDETYGEDPYLASRMLVAAVRALQGPGPNYDDRHVMATGKHYAGHGQPEAGSNIGPVNISERVLRETHLKTFEAAVKEAGLASIMPAYHEIDAIPCHVNSWLLDKVLKQEWGFKGVIVSDYFGVNELQERHRLATNCAEAARMALEAGVDVELPNTQCYSTLVEEVKAGRVPMAALDTAVARVLRGKFQLGLFENPYVDVERAVRVTHSAEHRALALEAAQKALVLLKNEGNLLPLDRSRLQSIAVIGPNAARAHYGGYTDPQPPEGVSILEGVRRKVGSSVRVSYAEGCKITKEGGNWWADSSTLSDEAEDRRLIAEAVEVAKQSDVAILVIGGNEDTNKEAWADNHLGDRDSIEPIGRQNDLVRAVRATGKPVIVFLINGGPLAIPEIAATVPAILEGFYLGEETGTAAADVLFGDVNPSGKLPVSFARSTGQLPIYYSQKPSARRGYLYTSKEPLFPFGHGLSYTTFAFDNVKLSKARIRPNEKTIVSVELTNTGTRAGTEIVQMYISDRVSSVTRPVMELKGVARVMLQPGEKRTVTLEIAPDALSFLNRRMQRVVEPGVFDVLIGSSSTRLLKTELTVN